MLERRFDSIEDEEENFNNLDTNNFKPNDNLLNDNIIILIFNFYLIKQNYLL